MLQQSLPLRLKQHSLVPAGRPSVDMISLTVGVLALQGGFAEHITLVRKAAEHIAASKGTTNAVIHDIEVRTKEELESCDALIIPGGESTTISFVAAQSGLLEPLRDFVK